MSQWIFRGSPGRLGQLKHALSTPSGTEQGRIGKNGFCAVFKKAW